MSHITLNQKKSTSSSSLKNEASSDRIQSKKKSYFYSSYFPLFHSKLQNKKEQSLAKLNREYKDQATQCGLVEFRLNVSLASHLNMATNSVFLPFQIKRFNRDKFKLSGETRLSLREIGVQTYADTKKSSFQLYDLDPSSKTLGERTLEDLVYNYSLQINTLSNKLSLQLAFVNTLYHLSEDSVLYLNKYLVNSGPKYAEYVASLSRLGGDKLKTLDNVLVKLIRQYDLSKARNLGLPDVGLEQKSSLVDFTKTDIHSIDLKKLIKMAEMKRKGVRFETSEEKRRLALERFKRIVRIVIINREWIKVLNSEKKEERDKLLLEYDKLENASDFMNGKKLQILFNREEFKAQKNLTALINDTHRRILAKDAANRTAEDIQNLLSLINSVPRLNSFPRHVLNHIAKIIKLIVYEKGRELVREGHLSIGFYYILNGSCDVLSMGNDGLLKIDELQTGDTFGDSSFQAGITPYTVITNQRTEMLMVEPNDIENYLDKLRLLEKNFTKEFISNWWPVKYWNWSEENFEKFSQFCEFLRFNCGELIADNSYQPIEKINFIYSGTVEMIRMINVEEIKGMVKQARSCDSVKEAKKATRKIGKKFVRVCFLKKYNYFGFESSQNVNMWFRAYEDDVSVIQITKDKFLSIHKHSSFFLSQLIQDYRLALPLQDQVFHLYEQKLKNEKLINKI
ncbi:cyclic nucleotide-binding domain-containing 2-like [Brachionus plicatilis]|uniref:Cyclic nucleotide-binding domain-containing 2-like n=1 Tax=Brachionus plicatilis TaxID=10195 RepID=A0A3M7RHQ1_BRAPC|nr:cyclic nucleotide-binding domain-containing 2-like [Brachionus plicatilis]